VRFHGARPAAFVTSAERALGVTFPPTYREFVLRYGCGGFHGCEFYGIINDDFVNSGVPDAIWLTLDERRVSKAPMTYVIVGSTGNGAWYAIDLARKTAEGDSPIVEWWPGLPDAEGNGRVIAEDFGAFLLENAKWAADDSQ
jgi:hypothetical protein